MSEFKFACPVCGQHITADNSASGGQIECPTCFQKIIVPQAPASVDSKFILSASQVAKPRPTSAAAAPTPEIARPSSSRVSVPVIAAVVILLCVAGAVLFVFRDRLFKSTRITWSLDLKKAVFPKTKAAGRIHGTSFAPDSAILQGGTLLLRQGKGQPPELGIIIGLRGWNGDDFAGRTVEVTPDQTAPVPRVTVRWKDDQQEPVKQDVTNGYALKLAFGQTADGHLPGQIYLCLPDEMKSVVAGTFDATLRKPKGSSPKGPKPKGPPSPRRAPSGPSSSTGPAAGTPRNSP